MANFSRELTEFISAAEPPTCPCLGGAIRWQCPSGVPVTGPELADLEQALGNAAREEWWQATVGLPSRVMEQTPTATIEVLLLPPLLLVHSTVGRAPYQNFQHHPPKPGLQQTHPAKDSGPEGGLERQGWE